MYFDRFFDVPADLLERVLDEGVPRHLDDSLSPEVPADLLHLLCGNTVHVDKPDELVLLCVLLDVSDLVLLPRGEVVGI